MGEVLPFRGTAEPRPRPEPLWREAIGEQLREERAARGERLADVAGRAGVSPQYLSELERGLKEPSSEVLAALAGALRLRVADLTSGAASRLSTMPAFRGPVCLAA
ncbi:MAG: helix-turn-helix domain-containing protein [Actinobacteria bacterium]|nr:helix-turn-helix domain-containing protein [Actinomycetota bacterium]